MNHISPYIFDVDLVIIFIAYLLLYFGGLGPGVFAFGLGILIDIFSVGPLGLFAFLYLFIFLGIKFGSVIFDLLSIRGRMSLIMLAVFAKHLLFFALLGLFSLKIFFSYYHILYIALSALCTGLLTPLVFWLLNRIYGSIKALKDEPIHYGERS